MADKKKPNESAVTNESVASILSTVLGGGQSGKTGLLGLPSQATSNDTGTYMDEPTTPPAGSTKVPGIYRDGAQNMPIMSNWDKVKVSALQQRLVQAGALDDDYLDGFWDPASAKAFEEILGEANNAGTPDFDVIINARINAQPMEYDTKTGTYKKRTGTGAKASNRAPLSLTLSNKDDLIATAQTVAQKRLGRTFSSDELSRFVSSYHSAETGNQRSQYADQTPGGAGGATMAEASPETAANTFAEEVDPLAAQSRNMLPMVDSINKLLNGSGDIQTAQPTQGGYS